MEVNDFDGKEAVTGLEHLGRAITDEAGVPSGSPANYENLRGRMAPGTAPLASLDDVISAINAEFPKEGK